MTFRFIGLADRNGLLPYKDHVVSLAPSSRQKDLSVSYYDKYSEILKQDLKF